MRGNGQGGLPGDLGVVMRDQGRQTEPLEIKVVQLLAAQLLQHALLGLVVRHL